MTEGFIRSHSCIRRRRRTKAENEHAEQEGSKEEDTGSESGRLYSRLVRLIRFYSLGDAS